MKKILVSSFFHADTTDLDRCKEIAASVQAIISGLKLTCFLSENASQVVFHCDHPDTLTRSSAVMLVQQFLRHHLDEIDKINYDNMRVIAIANEKGGVAKTTSCINLAVCLAMRERKVLLIDFDAQANATLGLGYSPFELGFHPDELLTDPLFPLHKAIVPTDIPHLDLVPSSPTLHEANLTLVRAIGRELKLRNKLTSYFAKPNITKYDYVLVDSPPAADILTLNVLMAATHLIVPVQASYYSLSAMGRLSSTMDSLFESLEPRIQLLGILVTMYNKSIPAQRAVLEILQEKVNRQYGPFLFSAPIGHSKTMNESEVAQRPIVISHPGSAAAEAYHKVAEDIIQRIEEEPFPISVFDQKEALPWAI